MNFIFLVGPPAVGKMSVGRRLAEKLDYRLFHNHHSIELALELFYYGSEEFTRINEGIRQLVFQTVAESKNVKGLIFTLVWAFNLEEDREYVEDIKSIFAPHGWTFYFVELYAPLALRLERNTTPERLTAKVSKRDLERSAKGLLEMEEQFQMNTDGTDFPQENYLRIDNSALSAAEAAELVIAGFRLGEGDF